MAEPVLIVLSGRSGTGKSSIARALADTIDGIWLRIDSIEQAILGASALRETMNDAGYRVAQAVAADNLSLGRIVIADCVNDWRSARDAWRDAGTRAGARVVEVEIVCSDVEEHRRRVETRVPDIPGLALPDWQATMARDYHPWDRGHLIVDTAKRSLEESLAPILRLILPSCGDTGAAPT